MLINTLPAISTKARQGFEFSSTMKQNKDYTTMRNNLSIFKKENQYENSENDYFKNRDNAMWDTKVLVHTEFML